MAIPVLLFGIAVAARVLVAALFPDPAYPDALYYANVARELAAGHGLSVDYIWNFVEVGGRLPAEGVLPIPSNAHWMPLAVVVQLPFIWLLGPTAMASALPFWLAAAAVAPLTYVIGRDARLSRWQAVLAGLLVAVPGGVTPYLGQPDNFALFMLLGSLALWLCARGLRGDRRAFALGGVVVGLAFLARNDGVLLAVPYGLAALADLVRPPRMSRIGWWAAGACVAGFIVVSAPWLMRQLDVFGSLSPSSVGGRILFIREYRELYSVSTETTLASFLAQGPLALVGSRLEGLLSAVRVFAVMPLLGFLAPLLLVGAWCRRRDSAFAPWLVYAAVLLAFSALVSAVHVPYGTFLHSAVALVPHAYLLSLVGLAAVVGWIARRRPSWDAPTATRNLSVMVVAVVLVVSAVATVMTVRSWEREKSARATVLETLARIAAPGDRLMSPDAGAYRYHGGWSGIVTPEDPLPVIEEALRLYGVRWLALEREHVVSGLRGVLAGEERPAWLSAPLVRVPENDGGSGGGAAAEDDGLPVAALYAVCLAPADERCRP
jgi:4-amino-4-deoxy-L-arabinose transferase-like glycosyltransferase